VSQPQNPDSSEQRWERIERNLDRVAEQQRETAQAPRESDRRAEEHRRSLEQFQQTMRAVIESLHKMDVRLDANLQMLSGLVAEHHDRLHKLDDE
jgi:small-conductance mechanosensitive channel